MFCEFYGEMALEWREFCDTVKSILCLQYCVTIVLLYEMLRFRNWVHASCYKLKII